MWLPKTKGGMNLPNIQLYNLSCLLRHPFDWITKKSTYTNVELEQEMIAPWNPEVIIHTAIRNLLQGLKTNILIRDTVLTKDEKRNEGDGNHVKP